jgi:hypothetical protein
LIASDGLKMGVDRSPMLDFHEHEDAASINFIRQTEHDTRGIRPYGKADWIEPRCFETRANCKDSLNNHFHSNQMIC